MFINVPVLQNVAASPAAKFMYNRLTQHHFIEMDILNCGKVVYEAGLIIIISINRLLINTHNLAFTAVLFYSTKGFT